MTAGLNEVTLYRLVEIAGEHAERVIVKDGDKLVATYILLAPKGRQMLVGCPWRDLAEKRILVGEVREIAHRMGATRLSFVSQGWKIDAAAALTTPPMESPQRREVVFAAATDGTETRFETWQIVRSRPGGPAIALVRDKTWGSREAQFAERLIDGILPSST